MAGLIRIGTRGSKLALWQANWVRSEIERLFDVTCELTIIKTKGDKILDVPLAKVGGKGLFVKEIEQALLEGRIDLAVHSMKDMPSDIPNGLAIGAVPERENPSDVLISKDGGTLSNLPNRARIGTASLRRAAQILRARPDFDITPLRGNLDTRLSKLKNPDEKLDAIVLAAAGVIRLGLEENITEFLDPDTVLPAVGQGALCIEIRKNDPDIEKITGALDHTQTRIAVTAERAFLHRLEGGCQVPIAGHAVVSGNTVALTGLVAGVDGDPFLKEFASRPTAQAADLGTELADTLLKQGADRVLSDLKETLS